MVAAPPVNAVPGPETNNEPVTLMVSAGPFTTTEDISYSPLTELLRIAASRRPSALVLLGPFVDDQHPAIASLDISVTFEQLFEMVILLSYLYSFT